MLVPLLSLLLSGAPVEHDAHRAEPLGWARRFFGPPAVDLLERTTHVEAFRLLAHDEDGAWRTGQKKADEMFDGYVVTARSGPLSVAYVGRLAAVLLSDDTYPQPRENVFQLKFCGGMHPGLGFRFTRGRQVLDVLLCLRCNDVAVVRGVSDKGKGLAYWPVDDLDQNRPLDFDRLDSTPGRQNLLLLAREAFPNDDALKTLKAAPERDD